MEMTFSNVAPKEVPELLARAVLLNREIKLSRAHIRRGGKKDCQRCPVALAILDVMPGARVNADVNEITVNEVTYVTPDRVEKFMGRFDYTINRHNISGFKFTLTELSYCQRPWTTLPKSE